MTHRASTNGHQRRDDTPHRRLRVALYSHDAMGVGHVRRNLLIAQLLGQPPHRATTLMICGVHEATAFCSGYGVDCLTIPSMEKVDNDDYRPRDLYLSKEDIISLRSATMRGSLQAFRPDLLVVDKVPKGLENELVNIVPALRAAGTRVVFGMREVLDDAAEVRREWKQRGFIDFLQQHYDQIWVYGDQQIFDPVTAYALQPLNEKIRFTGYFDQRERLKFSSQQGSQPTDAALATEDTVLCMVGGGQDGVAVAEAFAKSQFPAGMVGLLVTGPLMAPEKVTQLKALAARRDDLTVVKSVPEADLLMQKVARVVCMGGYNSMLSVVSFEVPALVVPRTSPRMEQSIRAKLFRDNGLVDVLESHELSPAAVSAWLANPPTHARPDRSRIDLQACQRVPELVTELFAKPPTRRLAGVRSAAL